MNRSLGVGRKVGCPAIADRVGERGAPKPSLIRYLRRHHVALLALFVALGGTSYAAVRLPAKSVGTKQLKKEAVTKTKINKKTLRALKGNSGPTGPQGLQGPKGDKGDRGSTGSPGATNVLVRKAQAPLAGAAGAPVVNCHAGERATGGAVEILAPGPSDIVNQSYALTNWAASGEGQTPNGWTGNVYIASGSRNVVTEVVCASP